MSFPSSVETFSSLAHAYRVNKTGRLFLKDATLVDLCETFGARFSGFCILPEETENHSRVKYNTIVVSAFEKQHFFGFVSGLLYQLCQFHTADFGFCTVNVPFGKFPRPSQEEFQKHMHL